MQVQSRWQAPSPGRQQVVSLRINGSRDLPVVAETSQENPHPILLPGEEPSSGRTGYKSPVWQVSREPRPAEADPVGISPRRQRGSSFQKEVVVVAGRQAGRHRGETHLLPGREGEAGGRVGEAGEPEVPESSDLNVVGARRDRCGGPP